MVIKDKDKDEEVHNSGIKASKDGRIDLSSHVNHFMPTEYYDWINRKLDEKDGKTSSSSKSNTNSNNNMIVAIVTAMMIIVFQNVLCFFMFGVPLLCMVSIFLLIFFL